MKPKGNGLPAEVQQYAPKQPGDFLGKLGQLSKQLIEELKESKSDALHRAETHAAACDANIDYLMNLAKAHQEAEADLVRRFEKLTADVGSMRSVFTQPYVAPPKIDEAAVSAALTAAVEQPAEQESTP